MIVYTTKLTVKKAVLGLAVLGAILWGITALAPHAVQSVATQINGSISQKLKDNDERVAYLHDFGWSVEETPIMEMEVQIPDTFDADYEAYNQMQMQQGLDLTKYQGKRAMVYVYTVIDYPTGEDGVTATIVLYKNKVIAADISSAQADGFQHGLTERPSAQATTEKTQEATPTPQTQQPQSPQSQTPQPQVQPDQSTMQNKIDVEE